MVVDINVFGLFSRMDSRAHSISWLSISNVDVGSGLRVSSSVVFQIHLTCIALLLAEMYSAAKVLSITVLILRDFQDTRLLAWNIRLQYVYWRVSVHPAKYASLAACIVCELVV